MNLTNLCSGVIKYHSLDNFKQSKKNTTNHETERELTAFKGAHVSRSLTKFQTCDLG
jgi:hypothetical protein